MLKNLIILPDGAEISSGAGKVNAIQNVTITECVNTEDDLTIGSAYANKLKATIIAPNGGLSLTAGDEVTLFKVDDAGTRTQVGVFTLEKPTRPTANTMKLTGYDHVAKLDKDLTEWLKSLTGWPYTVTAFAGMVCQECGLTFMQLSELPNSGFRIQQFFKSGVTGRQIMRWLGEICCRFVRATATGNIEFGWYTPAKKSITPSGDPYIFAGGLSYETYQVAPVDAVQLRLADSTEGALWPAAEEGANSYIISGNAILLSHVTEDLLPYLETIKTELSAVTYTPCNVSIPANLDIRAGNIVDITDKNGNTITAYVMTKTTSGQKDTLECTGSPRRDSSSSVNNKSASEKAAEAESYANSAAQQAVDNQTQKDIFDKLTNNGELQGLFMKDGKLYINGQYIEVEDLRAIGATIGGWNIGTNSIYSDVTTDNGTYRVYIQRYLETYGTDSWIYSVQKKDEETGNYTAIMYIRGDGKIYAPGFISSVTFEESVTFEKNVTIDGWLLANDLIYAQNGIALGPKNIRFKEIRYGSCELNDAERTAITFLPEMDESITDVIVMLTPKTTVGGVIAGKVTASSRTGFEAIIGGSADKTAVFSYFAIGF